MPRKDALSELREIVQVLAGIRRDRAAAYVKRAIELIDALEEPTITRKSKRGMSAVEYRVVRTSAGEALSEDRIAGTSQPFRVPRHVYDALAQVIEDSNRPLSIDELIGLTKTAGVQAADFQVRVPVRLWLSVQPQLLIRNRARYEPVDRHGFAAKARALWHTLGGKREHKH